MDKLRKAKIIGYIDGICIGRGVSTAGIKALYEVYMYCPQEIVVGAFAGLVGTSDKALEIIYALDQIKN